MLLFSFLKRRSCKHMVSRVTVSNKPQEAFQVMSTAQLFVFDSYCAANRAGEQQQYAAGQAGRQAGRVAVMWKAAAL